MNQKDTKPRYKISDLSARRNNNCLSQSSNERTERLERENKAKDRNDDLFSKKNNQIGYSLCGGPTPLYLVALDGGQTSKSERS